MKKLLSLVALASLLATQAYAQSAPNNPPKQQWKQRQMIQQMSEPLGPIQGDIGVATDPDPNVRLDLHRNYDHYVNGSGS